MFGYIIKKIKNGQDLEISRTGPWNIADRTLEYSTRTGPWNIQRGQDPGISRTGPWNIADRTLDIIRQSPGRQSPTYHIIITFSRQIITTK